jgi:hypothetical protein
MPWLAKGSEPLLNELGDGYVALPGKTAAVGFDTVHFVKGFSREVRRAAVRATHNGDVLDNQQAGASTVASGHMSQLSPLTTAVLASERRLALAIPHKQSEYTGWQPARTSQRPRRPAHQASGHGERTSTREFHDPFVVPQSHL